MPKCWNEAVATFDQKIAHSDAVYYFNSTPGFPGSSLFQRVAHLDPIPSISKHGKAEVSVDSVLLETLKSGHVTTNPHPSDSLMSAETSKGQPRSAASTNVRIHVSLHVRKCASTSDYMLSQWLSVGTVVRIYSSLDICESEKS